MSAGIRKFGTTADGQEVLSVTLRAGDLRVVVLTWGAILQDVRLEGVPYGLTLGSDRLEDYLGAMRYHGALIAPVVNRLTGAQAPIGGVMHRFDANQDGRHTLHSGTAGSHLRLWHLAEVSDSAATLSLDLPDGEGGFPGNRRLCATFALEAPATLRLTVTARSDRLTLMNPANHSYWNLDGSATWAGHRLRIAAARYLPTTADFTPTGAILATTGSALDFSAARTIAPGAPLLDNCFCLSDARRPLREVLWLTGTSGVRLTVATTEPGIQIYDGRNALRPGHGYHEGLAIETQGWPDAPNHAGFPSIELTPTTPLRQLTEWRFARD